ncbi:MAG: hypothetical protein VB088_06150 [Sphaerochaeta sp.]|nr:hypothetical protein [Sphaerochaeta sp.]
MKQQVDEQAENIAGLFRKLFLHIGNSLSDDFLGVCTLQVELKAVYRPFGLDKHYLYTCLLQVFSYSIASSRRQSNSLASM